MARSALVVHRRPRAPYADVPPETVPLLDRARRLALALVAGRGEASGAAIAQDLHETLYALSPDDRAAFFGIIADELQPDPAALRTAAKSYLAELDQ